MNDINILFSPEGYAALLNRDFSLADDIKDLKNLWNQYTKILQASEKINFEIKNSYKDKDIYSKKTDFLIVNKNKKKQIADIAQILKDKLTKKLASIPNVPDKNTPIGTSEKDNRIVYSSCHEKTTQDKTHIEIAKLLDIVDFTNSVKMSKASFVGFKNEGAKMMRLLTNFFLDHNKNHGYEEIILPLLLNEKAFWGTGQFPKFKKDVYGLTNENLYLIPTSEVSLINYFAGQVISDDSLPKKLTTASACFRNEGNTAGKVTGGLIRLHQFSKVEIITVTTPKKAANELEKMVKTSQSLLNLLKIPYQIIDLCTSELGFAAAKTYDIEVWFPSQKKFIEVASISNTATFQAKRLNIKYLDSTTKKKELVATLNGSSLALERVFAVILEQYYDEKTNSIKWPSALLEYGNNPLTFF